MRSDINNTLTLIKSKFAKKSFMARELYEAIRQSEENLPLSTLRWRLHSLKASGEIETLARGTYALTRHEKFENKLEEKLSSISKEIHKQFPYARFCSWSSDILNQFTIHQPSVSFSIIEVEKDAIEGVFSFLQEQHQNVFLNPTKKEIDLYLFNQQKSIIVKILLQRAPLAIDLDKNPIPKFEKILVDLLADTDLFSMYQGSELKNIWKEVCNKYVINISTFNNYAKRRKVDEKVHHLIKELGLLPHLITLNEKQI